MCSDSRCPSVSILDINIIIAKETAIFCSHCGTMCLKIVLSVKLERGFIEYNAPINSKLQPQLPSPGHIPGILNFEDWIVQIPAPSGQNGVQMPYPIVGFVCQTLLKSNRRRLLLSEIKLLYKHANTCFVTLYMMI